LFQQRYLYYFIIQSGAYQLISLFVFGPNYSLSACRFLHRLVAVTAHPLVLSELMLVKSSFVSVEHYTSWCRTQIYDGTTVLNISD